jgi:BASS family bile acid:Na+ symporter
LTLALLAIIITPVILNVFYALFVGATKQVSALSVAMQVGKVTFLPVMAGLILQRVAPGISERIGKAVRGFANALFVVLFVVLIGLLAMVPEMRSMLNLGGGPTAAILIMVGAGIAIGHGLGGPNQAQRASLAIACIARNVGLALYIAGLSTHGHTLIPTIMTYMILGALLAVPYAVWSKRQLNVG